VDPDPEGRGAAVGAGRRMHRLLRRTISMTLRLALGPSLIALTACGVAETTEIDPALRTADSLVSQAVQDGDVPGAVILVVRDGEVLLERAHGFAQLMELRVGTADSTPAYDP